MAKVEEVGSVVHHLRVENNPIAQQQADHESLLPTESPLQRFTLFLARYGVETQGIDPIPIEQRTDTRLFQMFFVWFSANLNVLGFSTGTAGPVFFSLDIKYSLVILLITDLISCTIPAYFAVFGPKLGTRAMVHSRFSWGYYGSIIPSIFNVFSSQSFLILNSIIGGQTLASFTDKLDATLGIVIIGIASLVVTFCGYRVLHLYESVAWIPNAISFPVMLIVGGKHLRSGSYPIQPPPSAGAILSFATLIASSVVSWGPYTPDYGVYHTAKASTWRIFIYTYLGFFVSSVTAHFLGAAFAAAAIGIPRWEEGFDGGNDIGGLIFAILEPLGGFGKFLTVIMALSVPSACAPTMYTFGTSFMTIHKFFAKVPRYVFAFISAGLLIPLAIVGATSFQATLVNILSLIGYWSTSFASIVLTEHFLFRRSKPTLPRRAEELEEAPKSGFGPSVPASIPPPPSQADLAPPASSASPADGGRILEGSQWLWPGYRYEVENWDKPERLPVGAAAIFAFAGSFAIIVPSMSQLWYEGPIAKKGTGDIGVLTGFVVAGGLYAALRLGEKKMWPNREH